MTELKIETTTVPDTSRVKAQEYKPVSDALTKADAGTAIKLKLPVTEHNALIRELRRVHSDNTVRSQAEGETITVWLVDKITRTRKPSEDAPATETVAEPVAADELPAT